MNHLRVLALAALVLVQGRARAPGAEAPMAASAPSSSATNLPNSFQIKKGFRIDLIASEPLVVSPVAMAFDENGRLFVAEMRDYPDRRKETPHLGRIRLLEDSDGDGKFDKATVYADNLPWPSAIACYGGGVFVAVTPDILYLKDTIGGGSADVRQIVFSGFGGGAPPADVRALVNNFNWAIDNRIHGLTAGLDGIVTPVASPGSGPVSLAGYDFSFDPRNLTLAPEAGPGQSGLGLDNSGRKYFTDLGQPLRQARFAPGYPARNPFFTPPRNLAGVVNPATRIFRAASPETGRASTTPPRAALTPAAAAAATNRLAPDWLTNACGTALYRGGAFPTNYLETVFIADAVAGVVHHESLRQTGLEPVASRPADEASSEYLLSREPGFHPVQLVNGPGGFFYLVDRGAGPDLGRIYRISASNSPPFKPPQLGKATLVELVVNLAHTNGWNRDTAARLLYERQSQVAVAPLTNMLQNSRLPLARLHALRTLDGLGALNETHLLKGFKDADERVVEHAIKLSEKFVKQGAIPDRLWNELRPLTAHGSLRVRYQLAFTLGEIRRPDRVAALAEILQRNPDDPLIQTAVLSSLASGSAEMFITLAGNTAWQNSALGSEFTRKLALMIGTQARPEELGRFLDFLNRSRSDSQLALQWLYALGQGLQRAGSSLPAADPQGRFRRFFDQALTLTVYDGGVEAARPDAARLLGVSSLTFNEMGDLLLLLLGSGESPALQSAVITALGRFSEPRLPTAFFARWPSITPALRHEAITALLSRAGRAESVMAALESSHIREADLSPTQANFLRTHRDPAIRNRAAQFFGPLIVQRPAVREQFRPVLKMKGAPDRGRDLFRARCADCHEIGGQGQSPGPDLAGLSITSRESILTAILEPNVQVAPEFTTHVIETSNDDVFVGIKADENLTTITLRQPNQPPVVVPRANVRTIEPQPWSLMPSGLERSLSPQDLADLLEFLMSAPWRETMR